MLKRAALINAAGKYSKILLSLIVNAVLARLLTPEDYGIVAIITVFSTLFAALSNMGFSTAIIQKKDLTDRDIDNIFSFTVYCALVLAVVFAAVSYPIASFYGDPVFVKLGRILSIALIFNTIDMVPNGILNREKRFKTLALRSVVVYGASSVVAIALAFFGWKYYALVVQSVLSAVFGFLWNYVTTRPKFIVRTELASVKKVISYSGYQFAFNIVNYFSRNLDNLLTGRFMGKAELGYYNKAYNLMLYPTNNLTGVISPVLHPILSDYQDDKEVIYAKYMRVLRLLACVAVFTAPVCFLGSEEIVGILYGRNWGESAVCFRLLALAIIPQMLNASAGAVFQALGNTRLLFINSCINTGVTVAAILIGVFAGGDIRALSVCVAAAYIFHFVTAFYMLMRGGFRKSYMGFMRELWREWLILLMMVAGAALYPFAIGPLVLSLAAKVIWLGLIYGVGLLATGDGRLLLSLLRRS